MQIILQNGVSAFMGVVGVVRSGKVPEGTTSALKVMGSDE